MTPELARCIPTHKSDHAAVEAATALGFPAINPILAHLLEWLQDINWPVADDVIELLAPAGPEIAPHIRIILNCDDDGWKWHLIVGLGKRLGSDVRVLILNDVQRLTEAPTDNERVEEVDEVARELLEFWGEDKAKDRKVT